MMPAHVPPPTPRLAINLSPSGRHPGALDAGAGRRAVGDGRHHADGHRRGAGRPADRDAGGDRAAHQLARLGALVVRRGRPGRVVARRARRPARDRSGLGDAGVRRRGVRRDAGRRPRPGVDVDAGDPRRPDRRRDGVALAGLPPVPGGTVAGGARPHRRRRVRRPARRPGPVRDARPPRPASPARATYRADRRAPQRRRRAPRPGRSPPSPSTPRSSTSATSCPTSTSRSKPRPKRPSPRSRRWRDRGRQGAGSGSSTAAAADWPTFW